MSTGRPPTTAEISLRAGVAKSTVSRALKGDPRISKATRTRILEIAAAMGYAPNAIAHSLATRQSRIVGFVGSELQNYWYQENIPSLARQVTLAERQLMLFQVLRGGSIHDVLPDMVQYRLAGCIVIPIVEFDEAAADMLSRWGVTPVLINRAPIGAGVCAVRQNQMAGARAVARFLLRGGHERIAFIAGNDNPAALQREEGFLAGLAEGGASLFARAVGDFTFRGAYAAAEALLDRPDPPDAIFAANDMMAYATLELCRRRGVRVPEDLSVIGYDNGRVAAWPGFSLTTVAQPIDFMFAKALDMILARAKRRDLPAETVMVDGELLVRSSARAPDSLDGLGVPTRRAPDLTDEGQTAI